MIILRDIAARSLGEATIFGIWVSTTTSSAFGPGIRVSSAFSWIKTDIYSGCYGRVCISLFAYNNAGKRGIGIGLEAVQKLRDGDALGGSVSVSDAFGAGSTCGHIAGIQNSGGSVTTAAEIEQLLYGTPAKLTAEGFRQAL